MELENNSFADFGLAANILVFLTEHNYIGTAFNTWFWYTIHESRGPSVPSTPLSELRARALRIREALEASMPKPPAIPSGVEGREHSLAVEAAAEFEPSIRDVFTAITAMSSTMLVRDEIKADVAKHCSQFTRGSIRSMQVLRSWRSIKQF